jgi:hypothetical protein
MADFHETKAGYYYNDTRSSIRYENNGIALSSLSPNGEQISLSLEEAIDRMGRHFADAVGRIVDTGQ